MSPAGDAAHQRREELTRLSCDLSSKYSVKEMSAREVASAMTEGPAPVLVDTRNVDEQQVSMLPQAISKADFEQQKDAHRDRRIVCYCTVGMRSSAYAQQLTKEGFEAYNLTGSIMAWTHEGLPLVEGSDGTTPTRRVHAYADRWALQADGYTPVTYSVPPARMVMDVFKALTPGWLKR